MGKTRAMGSTDADARWAIHDCLVRYCRGIDRGDEELIQSCYWEDSFDDHGSWKGNGRDFAAYVVPRLARYAATHHLLHNSAVEVDGDVAHAETYVHAHHLARPDTDGVASVFLFAGRYLDRLERRTDPSGQAEWRIAHRVVVCDWTRIDPITADVDENWKLQFARGTRDDSDPSYHRAG